MDYNCLYICLSVYKGKHCSRLAVGKVRDVGMEVILSIDDGFTANQKGKIHYI